MSVEGDIEYELNDISRATLILPARARDTAVQEDGT